MSDTILDTVALISLQIRIWGRKKAINNGQGEYALNVTGPILQFYERYYNASYPLSKSGMLTQNLFKWHWWQSAAEMLLPSHMELHSSSEMSAATTSIE